MAVLVCPDHGIVDTVTHKGYSLGHNTRRGEPNELDLEGIEFTFSITGWGEMKPDLELEDADNAEDYLSKFSDWEEVITRAAEIEGERFCGEDDCGHLLRRFEDESEIPDEM